MQHCRAGPACHNDREIAAPARSIAGPAAPAACQFRHLFPERAARALRGHAAQPSDLHIDHDGPTGYRKGGDLRAVIGMHAFGRLITQGARDRQHLCPRHHPHNPALVDDVIDDQGRQLRKQGSDQTKIAPGVSLPYGYWPQWSSATTVSAPEPLYLTDPQRVETRRRRRNLHAAGVLLDKSEQWFRRVECPCSGSRMATVIVGMKVSRPRWQRVRAAAGDRHRGAIAASTNL